MNRHLVFVTLILSVFFASCKKDMLYDSGIVKVESVSMLAHDFDFEGIGTKTSISIGSSGAQFTWKADDVVGVFPNIEGASQVKFPIINADIQDGQATSNASFTGNGWAVRASKNYSAYYPFVPDMDLDMTRIPVTYESQRQNGKNKTDHLVAYDYMATSPTEPVASGNIGFDFAHLGTLIQLSVNIPKASVYTDVELTCDEAEFIIAGTVDITSGTPRINPTATSHTFHLALDDFETTVANEHVEMNLMLAPVDLSGRTIKVKISGPQANFTTHFVRGENKPFRPGVAYRPALGDLEGGDHICLISGPEFNVKIKKLAHPDEVADFSRDHSEYDIKRIVFVANNKSEIANAIDVSADSSTVPIYATYDAENHCVTVISPAAKVYAGENAGAMFQKMEGLESIDFTDFDVSNSRDLSNMFAGCTELASIDLSGFDTGKVSQAHYMFSDCKSLKLLDFASMRTPDLISVEYMFAGCSNLRELRNFSRLSFQNAGNVNDLFRDCASLESLDLSNFIIPSGADCRFLFSGCSSLTELDLGCMTSPLSNVSAMFAGCSSLTSLDVSMLDVSHCESFSSLFDGCSNLTSIDLSGFNTENLIAMHEMFQGCSKLTSVKWGENFNTSKVESMAAMLLDCSSLKSIDISSFNTSSVISMEKMFSGCSSLQSIDLSHLITNNVTRMDGMFNGCSALTEIDLSTIVGTRLGNMSWMFAGCDKLEIIDLSKIITPNLKDMSGMFSGCTNLRTVEFGKSFDTHFVESMELLFGDCTSLTSVDVTMFNTGYLKNASGMISNCTSLRELDLSSFDTNHCKSTVNWLADHRCTLSRIVFGDAFVMDENSGLVWGLSADATIVCNRAQKDHLIRTQSFNCYAEFSHITWIDSNTGSSFAPVDETLFQEMLNKRVTVLHDDIITDKTIVFNANDYEGGIDLAGHSIISTAECAFRITGNNLGIGIGGGTIDNSSSASENAVAISAENSGWFNINEGTYINSSLNKPTVLVSENTELVVFGGVFKNMAYSSEPVDHKAILIDCLNPYRPRYVRGGTFYYQNPSAFITEPGYSCEGVNGVYTVYTVRQQ